MKKMFCPLVGLIIFALNAKAQETPGNIKTQETSGVEWRPESFSIGPGVGLDYGGIGVQMMAYPQKNIGLFFGGGSTLSGFGYNAGFKIRSQKVGSPVDPFFVAMYGYNAVGTDLEDKNTTRVFYGPSLGVGVDLHKRRNSLGYWSLTLLVPIRSSEASDWASQHGTSYTPITVSLGYKFIFR